MRKAGHAIGKFLGAGIAGTAKAAATGGLAYFGQKAITARVGFLQQHPMAGPLAMVALGHVAKRKMPVAGTALVGAGTYAGALAYDLNKMNNQAAATKPAGGTNALISPSDIRALISPSDIRDLEVDAEVPQLDINGALSLGSQGGF